MSCKFLCQNQLYIAEGIPRFCLFYSSAMDLVRQTVSCSSGSRWSGGEGDVEAGWLKQSVRWISFSHPSPRWLRREALSSSAAACGSKAGETLREAQKSTRSLGGKKLHWSVWKTQNLSLRYSSSNSAIRIKFMFSFYRLSLTKCLKKQCR